jgi:hypothetical protein
MGRRLRGGDYEIADAATLDGGGALDERQHARSNAGFDAGCP